MLYRPDVSFVPVFSIDRVKGKAFGVDSLDGIDYLLCINRSCDEFSIPDKHELLLEYKLDKQIWEVSPGGGVCKFGWADLCVTNQMQSRLAVK
jgi:hypothetical protein